MPRLWRRRCRSCEASIIWALTRRGRWMPLDAQPLRDDEPGGWIVYEAGLEWRTRPYRPEQDGDSTPRYRPHYATCPHAHAWRGVRTRAGRGPHERR